MKKPKPLTRQCGHCGAAAEYVSYHSRYSRYSTQDGMRTVYKCWLCLKTFCDRYGTAFYDLKTPEAKVERAVHQVLEGLGYESVARVEGVHPTSVHRWAERASQQAQLSDAAIVQQVSAATIELDEHYGFAGTKQHAPESIQDDSGKHWVHCSMVRENRLLLDVVVGPRTLLTAQMLVTFTVARLKAECWPLWCSDGWDSYIEALLAIFYLIVYSIRTRRRGRPRMPKQVPHPNLRYGQVVKHHSGRKLISISKRVVFGVAELIPLVQISTSLLERLNGTLRLHVSPMRRKTRSFAKCRSTLNMHVQLFKAYYNFCLAHSSLDRLTPAQAAGLTDHRWSVRELLTFGDSIFSKIS